jgi:AcrR family transcriptional regulator
MTEQAEPGGVEPDRVERGGVEPDGVEPGGVEPGRVEPGRAGPGIADQRRGQMLRAALDVISERGFADTRIADIAERIGISPALVIYYFKTKDQLLTEAIRHYEGTWYAEAKRRMDKLSTAAERIDEFVAMNLLPDPDPDPESTWKLWLDLWAQAARNADVADVRREFDEREREVVVALVLAGQEAGEFADIDPHPFSVFVCALLDGLAIQIALEDPSVDPMSAYELCMLYIADRLGFQWTPSHSERATAAEVRAGAAR